MVIENLAWLKYAKSMDVEWEQANREGLEVSALREDCLRLNELPYNPDSDAAADALYARMQASPHRPEARYAEPTDWKEIQEVLPEPEHFAWKIPGEDELLNRIKGAWTGRIAGCLLGKAIEGLWARESIWPMLRASDNYPMNRYIVKADLPAEQYAALPLHAKGWLADTIGGIAPRDDDTDYTVFALKLLETYGREFTPAQVLEGWLRWIPAFSTCTAERVAYRNALLGLLPPQTAVWRNPYREFIGAQIRGDLFGYINPGKPKTAAEMAWRDAVISHVKNGVYGEMFIAAMLAAAACTADRKKIIAAGLAEIPTDSRLRADVDAVLRWHGEKLNAEQAIQAIHELFDDRKEFDWCYTNSNAMIVVMALLYGEGDFGKSVCLAVQAAFDTDCNGATVGSILGMAVGFSEIDKAWWEPFQGKVATSIADFPVADTETLASRTLKLTQRP